MTDQDKVYLDWMRGQMRSIDHVLEELDKGAEITIKVNNLTLQQYGLTAEAEKKCEIEVREAINKAYDDTYQRLMDWRHEHGAEK